MSTEIKKLYFGLEEFLDDSQCPRNFEDVTQDKKWIICPDEQLAILKVIELLKDCD